METPSGQSHENLRQMADRLNCFIEEDFEALAGITPLTREAWRKRGTGPAGIRLGNRYLYPHEAVANHLKSLIRGPTATTAKGLL